MDLINRKTGRKRKKISKKVRKKKEFQESQEENDQQRREESSVIASSGTAQQRAKIAWATIFQSHNPRATTQMCKISQETAHREQSESQKGTGGSRLGIQCKRGFFKSLKPVKPNGNQIKQIGNKSGAGSGAIKGRIKQKLSNLHSGNSGKSKQKLISNYFQAVEH